VKILHVIPHFLPSSHFGGTPIVCSKLAEQQSKLKNQVTVATTDVFNQSRRVSIKDIERKKDKNYQVIRFRNISNPLAYKYKMSTPMGFSSYLRKNLSKFDVVHLHEYRNTMNLIISLALLKQDNKRLKVILQSHGTYDNYNTRIFFKSIFDLFFKNIINKNIDLYLVLSENERRLLKNKGVKTDKIKIISNGVEVEEINHCQNPPFKLPAKYILYLGRLDKRKGLDILIKAYAQSHIYSQGIKLLLVGNDDGYKKKCEILVKELKIEDEVLFHEPVSNVQKWEIFRQATLLSYVTKHEVFGLVPLEAAISGCWSLVDVSAGVAPIIKKYQVGETIKYGDIKSLTKALKIFSKKSSLINQKQINQLKKKFNWQSIAKESISLYLLP